MTDIRLNSRPTETRDEILARIKAKKAAQKPAFHNHLQRLLKHMKASRTYSIEDIEVFFEMSGYSFTGAGPAMTYGVREGYLDRVGRGRYVVTGKKIEGA